MSEKNLLAQVTPAITKRWMLKLSTTKKCDRLYGSGSNAVSIGIAGEGGVSWGFIVGGLARSPPSDPDGGGVVACPRVTIAGDW
jgi:hypothetical protein